MIQPRAFRPLPGITPAWGGRGGTINTPAPPTVCNAARSAWPRWPRLAVMLVLPNWSPSRNFNPAGTRPAALAYGDALRPGVINTSPSCPRRRSTRSACRSSRCCGCRRLPSPPSGCRCWRSSRSGIRYIAHTAGGEGVRLACRCSPRVYSPFTELSNSVVQVEPSVLTCSLTPW